MYGGPELFIAQLAEGLKARGLDVVLYSNGESTIDVETRWLYAKAQWPIRGEVFDNLTDFNHTFWAVRDALDHSDVIHVNNVPGVMCSRFSELPIIATLHHEQLPELSQVYGFYPEVNYVTISDFQRGRETMPRIHTIHHGIDLKAHRLSLGKRSYFAFLGRIAPMKGTHLAIEIAKKSGIPLKIAGEVQPVFDDYFAREVAPHIDGKFVDFVGEVDLEAKNELLGGALALLFPIQWNEPFGLVMIEAMACGTPVLALPGGSVPEVVRDGVSGHIGGSVAELAAYAKTMRFDPKKVRAHVEQNFSVDVMVRNYAVLYEEVLEEKVASRREAAPRVVA
jgi:glycosyltransferase involved in cell wall biosynthesis